jgi:hypothetical protein
VRIVRGFLATDSSVLHSGLHRGWLGIPKTAIDAG